MNIYGIFKSSVIFILDFIFKPSPIKLIRTKKSLLGPSNLQECIYTFHKQQYIVILDTLITNFNVFKTQLQNTPCINIPNRAIKSNTIDVKLFNMYNGPFCNFHYNINGVYIPYSIDVLCKQKSSIHESHTITDLLGNTKTYFYMKKLNPLTWIPDCILHLKKSTTDTTTDTTTDNHNETNKKEQ